MELVCSNVKIVEPQQLSSLKPVLISDILQEKPFTNTALSVFCSLNILVNKIIASVALSR